MLKRILVLLLCANPTFFVLAESLVSIPLLEQECMKLSPLKLANTHENTLPQTINKLEEQLVILYNLKDGVSYFHNQKLSKKGYKALLGCKLRLSDEFNQLLKSEPLIQIVTKLKQTHNNEYLRLAEQIALLQQQSLSIEQKSQLYTAEASFQQNITSQALSLKITNPECSLKTQINKKDSIDVNVAYYLLNQTNESCRKDIWLAYQHRADEKNQQALTRILAIRKQQAEQSGFVSYAQMQISPTYLKTVPNVKAFLNSQLHDNIPTPWNIAYQLKRQDKITFKPIASKTLLNNLLQISKTFGIRAEWPSEDMIRLWHNQFLLGDIVISGNTSTKQQKSQYQPILLPVIGRQFGYGFLTLPINITRYSQQQKLILDFARIISDFSVGSHFYLNNTNTDTKVIGLYWLTDYLSARVKRYQQQKETVSIKNTVDKSRQELLGNYRHQLSVLRALQAIELFDKNSNKVINDESNSIQKIYHQWALTDWSSFSLPRTVTKGALLYYAIFQSELAKYIFRLTYKCQQPELIYNTLIINEQQLPLRQVLTQLIGEPTEPKELIRRIQYAASHQSSALGTCPINANIS